MAKTEQILLLEPATELRFRGPFTDVVTSHLKLSNPSDRRVAFKVKTTAPKRYCVRPNSGIVDAKGSVSVAVMLQPFDYDPSEKNKHKFMVQTMYAPDGDISQDALWKDVNPEQLMDSKLKCVFEMIEGPAQNNLDVEKKEKMTSEAGRSSPKHVVKERNRAQLGSNNIESEFRKTMEECKRLKDELSQLRQENLQLKEEGLRFRRITAADAQAAPSTAVGKSDESAGNLLTSYCAVAIVFLVFGAMLGAIVF